ncbi:ABC transporter permease [Phytoactinopolyspora alkaliphila]|uniref:ABC transporter permease n=1 Tax=Phytoactinopolyspora alkaliphila TaxID=1783498 RepID=A0A6N9YIZ6_9ACTN|nr:ABC transporter permease [Phytoactinopolyspora alkaliphila]NED94934.1 ABC transporter permease [Phytoactinopolyspora alkaliphila]
MSPQPEAAPSGVIHDIGYRGYDGPRLGRNLVARALFFHSLRGVFGIGRSARSKVMPMGLFAVIWLPALVIAVITVVTASQGLLNDVPVQFARYPMLLQPAVAIFLGTQAPQAVSLDLRYNTLPLYLSRPLERVDYVTAKYAALATGVFILLAIPILTMYIGALLAELPAGEQTGDVVLALIGAALFSLVLAGIGLLIASLTARRGFGVAAIITVLVMSYSVVSGLQGIIGHGQSDLATAGWLGLLSPMTLVDGVQTWALGAESSAVAGPPGDLAGLVFCLVTATVVVGSYLCLMYRYRKVTV